MVNPEDPPVMPPAAANALSSGEARPRPRWVEKSMTDIQCVSISKPRLDFSSFGGDEDFFELHYCNLFLEIRCLAKDIFAGDGNLPGKQSSWVREYPQEFYDYTKAIARPDPSAKHWEGLLRNGAERVSLVQGILMKVLDVNIFSSLLFGASKKHEKVLKAHDIDLITVEGFTRSKLLARTNQAYLSESNGTPAFFWEEVERITNQIFSMLLPLYNEVGEAAKRTPSPDAFFQAVYDLVSFAGWLSVMTRTSPDITVLQWLPPGDNYELGQSNLLPDVFEHSKAKAREFDKCQGEGGFCRIGRAKISVFPKIERFAQGADHHAIHTVMDPHVVYYCGLPSLSEDEKTLMPLEEYIACVRKPRGMPPMLLVLAIGAVAMGALSLVILGLHRQGRRVEDIFGVVTSLVASLGDWSPYFPARELEAKGAVTAHPSMGEPMVLP